MTRVTPRRSFQRTPIPTRSTPDQSNRLKFVLLAAASIVAIGLLVVTLRITPRSIECRTGISTACPTEIETELQSLKSVSWWRVPAVVASQKAQLQQKYSTVTDLTSTRRLNGTVLIILTQAEPLFITRWQGQDWQVFSTKALLPTSKQPPYVVQWQHEEGVNTLSEQPSITWSTEQLIATQHLLQKLDALSPRVTKVTLLSPDEIEVSQESRPMIVVQVHSTQEVDRQLATLQAFFSSSTIEIPHQRVDVRFADVILQ